MAPEEYQVELSDLALGQMRAFEKPLALRIAAKLEDAARFPDHYFKRLSGREECKLRIGDYRVIGYVLHSQKQIFVESMDHRKRVYKRP